jgi:hypothetical protein
MNAATKQSLTNYEGTLYASNPAKEWVASIISKF